MRDRTISSQPQTNTQSTTDIVNKLDSRDNRIKLEPKWLEPKWSRSVVVVAVAVAAAVAVAVVWDTVECMCMYTPHDAHLQANS